MADTDNGEIRAEYHHPDKHVVVCGPVRKKFVLSDGSIVAPDRNGIVVLDHPHHAAEVAHLVGLHFEAHGHPDHLDGDPFVYTRPDAAPEGAAS